eukprot:m.684168 g.684168  ORF g.684168 m.684168 type:complete len:422 (-) comp58605_c0_seq54:2402-3667(-)
MLVRLGLCLVLAVAVVCVPVHINPSHIQADEQALDMHPRDLLPPDTRSESVQSALPTPSDIFLYPSEQSCQQKMRAMKTTMHIPVPPWIEGQSDPEASLGLAGYPTAESLKSFFLNDTRPIPDTKFRNGYMGTRHLEFWRSGLELYLLQKHVLASKGVDIRDPPEHLQPFRVMDFGGSTGRCSRHWVVHEPQLEVIPTDTNEQAVAFMCAHGFGKPLHNDFVPPLDIAPNSISFFFALSVWTHMTPGVAIAWFKEVRRVLQPGGYAWITVMGDHTWRRLHSNMERDLLFSHITGGSEKFVPEKGEPHILRRDDLNRLAEMPRPYTYFLANWHWPYKTGVEGEFYINAFTSYAFIREHVSEFLEIVDIFPQNSLIPPEKWQCATPQCNPTRTTGQDVILLRKRMDSPCTNGGDSACHPKSGE